MNLQVGFRLKMAQAQEGSEPGDEYIRRAALVALTWGSSLNKGAVLFWGIKKGTLV